MRLQGLQARVGRCRRRSGRGWRDRRRLVRHGRGHGRGCGRCRGALHAHHLGGRCFGCRHRLVPRFRHVDARHLQLETVLGAGRQARHRGQVDVGDVAMRVQRFRPQGHAGGVDLGQGVMQLRHAGAAAAVAGHRHHVLLVAQGVGDEGGEIAAGADFDEHAHAVGVEAFDGLDETHRVIPLRGGQLADRRGVLRERRGAAGAVQLGAAGAEIELVVIAAVGVRHRLELRGVVRPAERQLGADRAFGGELLAQRVGLGGGAVQHQLVGAVVHRQQHRTVAFGDARQQLLARFRA